MKRSLLILSALCLGVQAYCQGFNYGFIDFANNYWSVRAPVYGPELNNPHEQKWGNAADAYPPGTQTYTGVPLAGAGYSVGGWYSLSPVMDVYALNTGASPLVGYCDTSFYLGDGYFGACTPYAPDVHPPALGMYLQVRAWDNAGGQYGSWDEAWNAAQSGSGRAVGWSKVFWQPVAYGTFPPPGLYNFESFNVFIAIPEPASFMLMGLGGLLLHQYVAARKRKIQGQVSPP